MTHYLLNIDISTFNPKSPPPKTPAFCEIVDASRAPEDAELADVLDTLGEPDAVTLIQIKNVTSSVEFIEWLRDRRNARTIPSAWRSAITCLSATMVLRMVFQRLMGAGKSSMPNES